MEREKEGEGKGGMERKMRETYREKEREIK